MESLHDHARRLRDVAEELDHEAMLLRHRAAALADGQLTGVTGQAAQAAVLRNAADLSHIADELRVAAVVVIAHADACSPVSLVVDVVHVVRAVA